MCMFETVAGDVFTLFKPQLSEADEAAMRAELREIQMLQQVVEQADSTLQFKSHHGGVEVIFKNQRHQIITTERQNERYILTSIILKRKQVKQIGRSRILLRLWQRNRETNVVVFSLDKHGQLVGQIEQLAETIDLEELTFYLELLARECDQFEYILTGKDIH